MIAAVLIPLIAQAINFGVDETPKVIAAIQKLREMKPAGVTTDEWLDRLSHPAVVKSINDYLAEAGARAVVNPPVTQVQHNADGRRAPAEIADEIKSRLAAGDPVKASDYHGFEFGIAEMVLSQLPQAEPTKP